MFTVAQCELNYERRNSRVIIMQKWDCFGRFAMIKALMHCVCKINILQVPRMIMASVAKPVPCLNRSFIQMIFIEL